MLDALSTTITNLISLLIQSLRLPAIFPALCFVILNQIFFLHRLNETALTLILTVLVGYTINVLNFPVIRLFEGYPFRLTWWGCALTAWQRGRKRYLEERIAILEEHFLARKRELIEEYPHQLTKERLMNSSFYQLVNLELSICEDELEDYFPKSDAQLVPTALGNAMTAFERYPSRRYGLDAIYFWPRLLPILSKEEYAIFVEKEKTGFDFLLNLSLLMGIFAIECVALRLILGWHIHALLPLLALCTAYLFYRGATQSALNWGETIKTAFDLYRYQLAEHLALRPFRHKQDETNRWRAMTNFIHSGNVDQKDVFGEFDYPLPRQQEQKG
jgi:hypothetical protein